MKNLSDPIRNRTRDFTAHSTVPQPTAPPIQTVTWPLSLWVKLLGLEANHLPPSSAEVKNEQRYTSTHKLPS